MRDRTKARECALKILYAVDVSKDSFEHCINTFWDNYRRVRESIKDFCNYLVNGVAENKEYIDTVISEHATNWKIGRMATVDRNILRLATLNCYLLKISLPRYL